MLTQLTLKFKKKKKRRQNICIHYFSLNAKSLVCMIYLMYAAPMQRLNDTWQESTKDNVQSMLFTHLTKFAILPIVCKDHFHDSMLLHWSFSPTSFGSRLPNNQHHFFVFVLTVTKWLLLSTVILDTLRVKAEEANRFVACQNVGLTFTVGRWKQILCTLGQ